VDSPNLVVRTDWQGAMLEFAIEEVSWVLQSCKHFNTSYFFDFLYWISEFTKSEDLRVVIPKMISV
jgi:hypothetical protein